MLLWPSAFLLSWVLKWIQMRIRQRTRSDHSMQKIMKTSEQCSFLKGWSFHCKVITIRLLLCIISLIFCLLSSVVWFFCSSAPIPPFLSLWYKPLLSSFLSSSLSFLPKLFFPPISADICSPLSASVIPVRSHAHYWRLITALRVPSRGTRYPLASVKDPHGFNVPAT